MASQQGIDGPKPDDNHRCGYCDGGSIGDNSPRDVGRALGNDDSRRLFHHSDNFDPHDDLATDHHKGTPIRPPGDHPMSEGESMAIRYARWEPLSFGYRLRNSTAQTHATDQNPYCSRR